MESKKYKVYKYGHWFYTVVLRLNSMGDVIAVPQDASYEGDYHNHTMQTKPYDESVIRNYLKQMITESVQEYFMGRNNSNFASDKRLQGSFTQARHLQDIGKSPEERKQAIRYQKTSLYRELRSTLAHEIQHAIQYLEGDIEETDYCTNYDPEEMKAEIVACQKIIDCCNVWEGNGTQIHAFARFVEIKYPDDGILSEIVTEFECECKTMEEMKQVAGDDRDKLSANLRGVSYRNGPNEKEAYAVGDRINMNKVERRNSVVVKESKLRKIIKEAIREYIA